MRVANANASAVPQSMPFPSLIDFTLASNIFFTNLWKFLSGNSLIFNPVSYNLYIGIPVFEAFF